MTTEARDPETPQLSERPEARSFSVEDLLREVLKGRVRRPRFQRGLKWEDSDRIALFDSLYRGFPVGTLLLWRNPAQADVVQLGRLVLDVSERSDALFIVDGQQRITTLVDALLADPRPPDGRALRFDLEKRKFAYGTAIKLAPPQWLPVSELLDSSRLVRWLSEHSLVEEPGRFDAALAVGKRIREYQIPAYIVEPSDKAVLPQIFERTNQAGKRMTKDEVFDALFMGDEDEGASSRSLRAIASSPDLLDLDFGKVPEKLILQALIALEDRDPSKGAEQFKGEESRIHDYLAKTQRALVKTIGFLKEVAEVPHLAVLPYAFPLAGLCRFFHFHPEANANSRKLLSRWLWRGAQNREHAAGSKALRRMIEAIAPNDEEGSVQRLLQTVARPPEEDPGLGRFDSSTARSRWQLAALATRQPRSLRPPELFDQEPPHAPLALGDVCDQDVGPALRLLSDKHLSLRHANEVTSRVLHPEAAPSDLRAWIAACEDDGVLATHVISPAAQEMLRAERMQEFLDLRAQDVTQLVDQFLARKADWDPPDRDIPTVGSLVLEDE